MGLFSHQPRRVTNGIRILDNEVLNKIVESSVLRNIREPRGICSTVRCKVRFVCVEEIFHPFL
jgi:hypothetical protein